MPPPAALMIGFGDSSIDFELFAHVDAIDKRLRVRDELYRDIERALGENGIEIPFPQRDLHIRSAAGLAESVPRSEES